jgi:hypothetical protein
MFLHELSLIVYQAALARILHGSEELLLKFPDAFLYIGGVKVIKIHIA